MITINFTLTPDFEVLAESGIVLICDENMDYKITGEDYARMEELFPETYKDSFEVGDVKYDVRFDSDTSSDRKGFESSFAECKDYIDINKDMRGNYFEDYRGGSVSIISLPDEEVVYTEEI